MRLKSIKLAGFKSFVDPTTVHFPSNLCAVVGPNGCGKSNIIDAVRWVMGESSAKNLRGEQMTDVIFNGSTNRKPVGQASVELVFDNSDHKITGEYARFNEISVKRLVNSDAQNTYYLNGTKCRRRDIADIFLGTGLGPRSYSIIEQGMVSKLIESKPEEMRVFIEEAAGISKYKERRRETENRIRRTKENLERLTDIRDELERQLQHLQRQAKAAEKFKEYKQEERDMTARLNALRWQALDQEVQGGETAIRELEVTLEASNADFRRFEAQIEELRDANQEVHDSYNEIQAQFYGLGGDISRIEQNIEHQKQRRQQLEEDLRMVQDSLEQARGERRQDEEKIAALQEEFSLVEPELEDARAQEEESLQAQESAEEVMANWQHEWEAFNERSATVTRNAEVERQRIEHLENIIERGQQRRHNLESERQGLVAGPEEEEIALLEESLGELRGQQEELEERNETVNGRIEEVRRSLKDLNEALNQARSVLQGLIGRRASLEALQQAALGQSGGAAIEWLKGQNLQGNARLVDDLKVSEGWDRAVETVLGQHLQAVCVDALDAFSEGLAGFSEGQLSLLDAAGAASAPANGALAGRELKARVSSRHDLDSLLDGIYCADSLPEALGLRAHLRGAESLLTPQGIWIGRNWLRLAMGFDEKAGMIQRQEEIDQVAREIEEREAAVAELEGRLEQAQQQLAGLEQEKEEFLQQLGGLGRRISELAADRSARLMKVEQVSERRQRLNHELGELERQLAVEKENVAAARTALEAGLDAMAADTEKREELLRGRDEFRGVLDASRQKARHDRDHVHQLALRHQTLLAQLNSLKSAMERVAAQVRTYEVRQGQLQEHLRAADDPIPALRQSLEEKLATRVEVEARLTQAKTRVDAIDHEIRQLEHKRHEAQENSQKIRDLLVSKRLGMEGATVRREGLAQTLRESQYDLREVLGGLPEEFSTESACAEELERIGARIQRLGPINLAAIDEYTAQSERKLYLDSQNEDLQKALLTLENAIRKIDKETRTRFKETFDKINNGLQELFPKVFGGGHAYLDMLGEDLLDTGVAIMARPPGKKNSTIHLLSGGEKAMTAIALVFSIFRLNPSPFCMLDEVDAPLDDANVGRYNKLVKEMSEVVQFIFITHNRITMEMAHQLMGVTMHEPGVSRMVAVDVDEAAELAAM